MCTKKVSTWCSELDRDREKWSKDAPLAPPEWVISAFGPMRDAIVLADEGRIEESIKVYGDVPDRALNEWFDLHAQYVYKWRCGAQGVPEPAKLPKAERAMPLLGSSDGPLSREIYRRDSYRCRYCGLQLFAIPAFKRFQRLVGEEVFPTSKHNRNSESAGAYVVFRPVADHVEPWSRGGRTDLSNLVTSCWPCNFGKMEYTVEELRITDPRTRPPVEDGWDGLMRPRS